MARKSIADRINEILQSNPLLKRDDLRIKDLIFAESQLRKAQLAARKSEVLSSSAAGTDKRSPALVALEQADKSVRRLRNDLQIDRLGVKRNEQSGVKTKRSPSFDRILEIFGPQYKDNRGLVPREAAFLAAHGIEVEDMPVDAQELFRADLEAQKDAVDGIRERLKAYRMW